MVIGAGGIGSFLCQTLAGIRDAGQIEGWDVVVFDPDVVEEKNIKYQCFSADDVMKDKVEAVEDRFGFIGEAELVTEAVLTEEAPDFVISAVDDTLTRKLVYSHWAKTGTPFIDLRAEGRTVSYFTPGGDVDEWARKSPTDREARRKELYSTLPKDDSTAGSCQLKWQLEQGIIELGNQIVAPIGAQVFLSATRGVQLPGQYVRLF